MTKFSVELFFYKDSNITDILSDIPDLDSYKKDTLIEHISESNWNKAKEKILSKYPNVAYIHILDKKDLDINE